MTAATNDNRVPPNFEHMETFAAWWRRRKSKLDWQSMQTFAKYDGPFGLADPMILRSEDLWVLGTWLDGEWVKVTDGACYPLEAFTPLQWAEPTISEHEMLASE